MEFMVTLIFHRSPPPSWRLHGRKSPFGMAASGSEPVKRWGQLSSNSNSRSLLSWLGRSGGPRYDSSSSGLVSSGRSCREDGSAAELHKRAFSVFQTFLPGWFRPGKNGNTQPKKERSLKLLPDGIMGKNRGLLTSREGSGTSAEPPSPKEPSPWARGFWMPRCIIWLLEPWRDCDCCCEREAPWEMEFKRPDIKEETSENKIKGGRWRGGRGQRRRKM